MSYWIYKKHSILEALNNKARQIESVFATTRGKQWILESDIKPPYPEIQIRESSQIAKMIKDRYEAKKIEIAAKINPLPNCNIHDIAKSANRLIILDKITNPQNIGSIIRCASGLGACAILINKDGCPDECTLMSHSSSGMIEHMPIARVTNISQSIDILKKQGFWICGMCITGKLPLSKVATFEKIAIVLGSEGSGMRKLVASKCDVLSKIPISSKLNSLNVATATAIALYEIGRCNH